MLSVVYLSLVNWDFTADFIHCRKSKYSSAADEWKKIQRRRSVDDSINPERHECDYTMHHSAAPMNVDNFIHFLIHETWCVSGETRSITLINFAGDDKLVRLFHLLQFAETSAGNLLNPIIHLRLVIELLRSQHIIGDIFENLRHIAIVELIKLVHNPFH